MKNVKYASKRVFEKGLVLVIKNSNDFKTLENCNPELIQVTYLTWTANETRLLALKYANGSEVYINRTRVTSPRFPRPYIPNATPEQMIWLKKQQQVENNKTCLRFIKEVYKIITKGYGADPRNFVELAYNTALEVNRPYMPKTNAMQQCVDGIEEGLAELNIPVSERETCIAIKNIGIYADGYDCYKHTVTNSVPVVEKKMFTIPKTQKTVDGFGITRSHKTFVNTEGYSKSAYYVQTTNEVFTWKEAYREKGNTSAQVYVSDVKDHIASEKIKEALEITSWLAEHDMLDIHAIHCPHCRTPMNVHDGCTACGYSLPKEAISEYTHGRITETELSQMLPEVIAENFYDNETDVAYAEWQDIEE